MTNRIRGEVAITAKNRTFTLCLTLGALAEIETALAVPSLDALRERLTRLSARDLMAILAALLRGGGEHEAARALQDLCISPEAASAAIAACFEAAAP